jgi:hypothetical protein
MNHRNRRQFEAWMAFMRGGDFENAWRVSDQVLADRRGVSCAHLPLHQRWLWDGQPIAGEAVRIHCYHGLGDTTQFIRYAPVVKQVAREVSVVAPTELLSLLGTVDGIDRLIPLDRDTAVHPDGVDVEVMELPHLFRTTLATIPCEIPYLHVERAALAQDDFLNVGVVWRAGMGWDDRRNVSERDLFRFGDPWKIRFHVLQENGVRGGLRHAGWAMSQRADLFELAQLMLTLDLVISVDSMPAHLAGALGVPVWTLLHADADWRWMEARDESPWYPTMRLFRQQTAGDWQGVLDCVALALHQLTNPRVSPLKREPMPFPEPVTNLRST